MRVDVSTSIVIERSLAEVSEFSANPDNAPHWYDNIKAVRWQTERPLRVGSQIAFEATFLGRRLGYTYEVVTYAPEERLVMVAKRPFPMETTYRWYPLSDGSTKMELRNAGDPSGLFGLFAPWVERQMRRANQQDLAHLRTILENPQLDYKFQAG